jgi:hypothetical protein
VESLAVRVSADGDDASEVWPQGDFGGESDSAGNGVDVEVGCFE